MSRNILIYFDILFYRKFIVVDVMAKISGCTVTVMADSEVFQHLPLEERKFGWSIISHSSFNDVICRIPYSCFHLNKNIIFYIKLKARKFITINILKYSFFFFDNLYWVSVED